MDQTVEAAAFPSVHSAWQAPMATAQLKPLYGRAGILSCVVHGLLLACAFWGFQKTAEEPLPMVRLVFVEPPPPPPAPLGVPLTEAPMSDPVQPSSVQEQVNPKPQESDRPKKAEVKPKPREPERLKITKRKAQEKPQPQPKPLASAVHEPEPVTLTTNTAALPPAGLMMGAKESDPKGVVGGQTGGLTGGVIGGQGTELLPVAQVANPPVLLTRVTPEYPRQARRQGVSGLVVLEAILDREGRVEDHIKVRQSIPLLDEAAIQALRQWRFGPARNEQLQTVRVILEVPIRFVLR